MWAVEKEKLGRNQDALGKKAQQGMFLIETMDEVRRNSKCLQGFKLNRPEEGGH